MTECIVWWSVKETAKHANYKMEITKRSTKCQWNYGMLKLIPTNFRLKIAKFIKLSTVKH